MNRNSVRKSPTPSAPHSSAPSASEAEPRFAATSMRRPSVVLASTCLYSSRAARSSASVLRHPLELGDRLPIRVRDGRAFGAVDRDRLGVQGLSRARPTPTTAGMPMERAMIETCEVLDPSAVTNASAMPFWMRAVSEGARLCASTTEGLCRASKPEAATAHELGGDLARHVTHVVGAGGEVLVIHRRELGGVLLTGGEHRGLGTLQVPRRAPRRRRPARGLRPSPRETRRCRLRLRCPTRAVRLPSPRSPAGHGLDGAL